MGTLTRRSLLGGACAAAALRTTHRVFAQATPVAGWQPVAPLPVARSEFAGTVLDGKMYVAGGYGAEAAFTCYDPAARAWQSLADLPSPRNHLGFTASDDALFVVGGHDHENSAATDTFWRYDVAGDRWESLEPLPQGARGALGAVYLDGAIYAVGGSSGDLSGPATNDVVRYDLKSGAWETCSPLPTAREHLGVATTNGTIVAVGGRSGGNEDLALISATEVYDPESDTWTSGAPLPDPRAGLSAVALDGLVYILGGERFTMDDGSRNPTAYAPVNVYNVDMDQWSTLPDLPVARHGMASAILDHVLYGIGGSTVAGQAENTDEVDAIALE